MGVILIVDDQAIIRDPIAKCLGSVGHRCVCAASGTEALALARKEAPDLILLDLHMPGMDGLAFLEALRSGGGNAGVPVILLTSEQDRSLVIRAAKLGVRYYILKTTFSLDELLSRVRVLLPTAAAAAEGPRAAGQAPPPGSAPEGPRGQSVPKLLTRDESLGRAKAAMQGKTLSGVVAQVIALAGSPRGDAQQLAGLIAQDSVLCARVLKAANSAAFASGRGMVTSISEAIKNVGCSQIRNIAAAVGVFEAMPESTSDGFNPIRCWQHSFAVARISEMLAQAGTGVDPGTAYLSGLCHDLGDILFHSRFSQEYTLIQELHVRTGKSHEELERAMLGIRREELSELIFQGIGLPDSIRGPIEAIHAKTPTLGDPLSRVLMLAEWYANGSLLSASSAAKVSPILQAACKAAVGNAGPASPDSVSLRSEVFALTAMLARLSRQAETELTRPLFERHKVRVWLACQPVFSSFDPLAAALSSMAGVDVRDRLPTPEEAAGVGGLVVVAKAASAAAFSGVDISKLISARGGGLPALWLVGLSDDPGKYGPLRPVGYPVPLSSVAAFVREADGARSAAAA